MIIGNLFCCLLPRQKVWEGGREGGGEESSFGKVPFPFWMCDSVPGVEKKKEEDRVVRNIKAGATGENKQKGDKNQKRNKKSTVRIQTFIREGYWQQRHNVCGLVYFGSLTKCTHRTVMLQFGNGTMNGQIRNGVKLVIWTRSRFIPWRTTQT